VNFWADLKLPRGILVKGGIPTSRDPADLVSDMVEIDLPDGTTLDVGWVPEHDPSGRYRLKLYRGYWAKTVEGPLYSKSRDAIIAAIGNIVRERSAPQSVAASGSIEVGMPTVTAKTCVRFSFAAAAGS
jgi:hypothetical protein